MSDLLEQDVVPPPPSYREIPLTQGKIALVDKEDYERISQFKWYAWKGSGGHYYARRSPSRKSSDNHSGYMHREVLGLLAGDERVVDHINRMETLDNRRCNIRIATQSQNLCNRIAPSSNTSGHKGVSLIKSSGLWNVKVQVGGKQEHVGNFASYSNACAAYVVRARQLHKEFFRIGDPQ